MVYYLGHGQGLQGEVPDWNQPQTYGDFGYTGSPAGKAWCSPTSASNIIGYLNEYGNSTAGQAIPLKSPAQNPDIDDNALFPAYGTWGDRDWRDHLYDDNRPSAGGTLACEHLTDLGWFMNTNNDGDTLKNPFPPALISQNAAIGTTISQIHKGLVNFFEHAGYSNNNGIAISYKGGGTSIGVFGNQPAQPLSNVADTWNLIKTSIDDNRPLIACFRHWAMLTGNQNVVGPGGAGEGQYTLDYLGFDYWTTPSVGDTDEVFNEYWNGEAGESSLGHTVTIVGYIDANDPTHDKAVVPGCNWIVVHDNSHHTTRNIALPFWPAGGVAGNGVDNEASTPWDELIALIGVDPGKSTYTTKQCSVSTPTPQPTPTPTPTNVGGGGS